ncbi:hypothetical protein B0H13DRAFT_2302463 [Mycena leptocephala]|nr:hypothetical protein B0H13DRAFT_2302463 [Mycena leptocephala]
MAEYNDLFGSILISSWLSAILYGVVLCQTWKYMVTAPKDARSRKVLVCWLTTSTLAMIAEFANVYYPTVTFWGNTVAILTQYWPVPTYVTCNSFTGVMVNGFLIIRVYRLTNNPWISLWLAIFVTQGLVSSIMVGVIIARASDIASARTVLYFALFFCHLTCVEVDLLRALPPPSLTVVYPRHLHRYRSDLKITDDEVFATNSLIQPLVLGTIQTGSATSAIAIMTMVAFYIGKNNTIVPTAFHYLIGPLYMLTLLYNFNLRRQDGVSGRGRSGSRTTDTHLAATNIRMDVQVHRTAIVSMDPPDAHAPQGPEATKSYGETKVQDDTEGGPFGAKKVRVAEF